MANGCTAKSIVHPLWVFKVHAWTKEARLQLLLWVWGRVELDIGDERNVELCPIVMRSRGCELEYSVRPGRTK
jgi:hypothetical protein